MAIGLALDAKHRAAATGSTRPAGLAHALCRYITRPALANERVQSNAAGQVVLKLKTRWRGGTTHQVRSPDARQSLRTVLRLAKGPSSARAPPASLSPLEFMQRPAALVLRSRLHLIRLASAQLRFAKCADLRCANHGVPAPYAKLRAMVVPQEPEPPAHAAPPAACEANCAHRRPARLSWARLLKRVFALDLWHCPNSGGELKIVAAILEAPLIAKILMRLGLQARAPTSAPALG